MEGAAAEDGRTPCIWDTFTHAGESISFSNWIGCMKKKKRKKNKKKKKNGVIGFDVRELGDNLPVLLDLFHHIISKAINFLQSRKRKCKDIFDNFKLDIFYILKIYPPKIA